MGQRNEAVTTSTWSRLMDADSPVFGLCAIKGGEMAGLVHYILHPTTGAVAMAAYMQDVYVDPAFRQQGIARALVGAVAEAGRAQGWSRLYWLADADNAAAQALYKNMGIKLNFNLFIQPLNV